MMTKEYSPLFNRTIDVAVIVTGNVTRLISSKSSATILSKVITSQQERFSGTRDGIAVPRCGCSDHVCDLAKEDPFSQVSEACD